MLGKSFMKERLNRDMSSHGAEIDCDRTAESLEFPWHKMTHTSEPIAVVGARKSREGLEGVKKA